MKAFMLKLVSREYLLAVAAAITSVSQDNPDLQVGGVILSALIFGILRTMQKKAGV